MLLEPRVEIVRPQGIVQTCFLFLPEEMVFVFPGWELLCVGFLTQSSVALRPSSLFLKDFSGAVYGLWGMLCCHGQLGLCLVSLGGLTGGPQFLCKDSGV